MFGGVGQLPSLQISFLVIVVATQRHTLLQNRNLFAKTEELVCGRHAFIGRLFVFLFVLFGSLHLAQLSVVVVSHESTATGFFFFFFSCPSLAPSDSVWLPLAGVAPPTVGVFSHRGGGGGGWRCTHIQGCTLNDHYCLDFFVPLEGSFCHFCVVDQQLEYVLHSQLKQPSHCFYRALADQTLFTSDSLFVFTDLSEALFLIALSYLRRHATLIHCVCLVVACGIRLVKQDPFFVKIFFFNADPNSPFQADRKSEFAYASYSSSHVKSSFVSWSMFFFFLAVGLIDQAGCFFC